MGLLHATLTEWGRESVLVAELALSSSDPLRPRVRDLGPEDKTGYDIVFVRVQDRALFIERIHPLLDQRAKSAGPRATFCLIDGGEVLEVGRGRPLRIEVAAGDLAALVYNGRRLPGLRAENSLAVTPDDPDALSLLFPDTGASRCALDSY